MNNPIANPSNPSVRFTALDVAATMKIATGIYRIPKSKFMFFKNGIVVAVLCPPKSPEKYTVKPTAKPTINCPRSLYLPINPLGNFLMTLR